MAKRATFATKLGVIAATAGSSVGLGNIWRFPYETGQNGGAAFLLVYFICVLILGLPVMLAEFTIGRSAKSNASRAFIKLTPKTHWYIVGILGIFAAVFIMGFYSVIAGWTLDYVYQSLTFGLSNKSPEAFQTAFTEFTKDPIRPIFWTGLFLLVNYVILVRGVHNGPGPGRLDLRRSERRSERPLNRSCCRCAPTDTHGGFPFARRRRGSASAPRCRGRWREAGKFGVFAEHSA